MNDFFTISEVSKVCDISRSTIMRLEERGLLTPAHIDEKTGYPEALLTFLRSWSIDYP